MANHNHSIGIISAHLPMGLGCMVEFTHHENSKCTAVFFRKYLPLNTLVASTWSIVPFGATNICMHENLTPLTIEDSEVDPEIVERAKIAPPLRNQPTVPAVQHTPVEDRTDTFAANLDESERAELAQIMREQRAPEVSGGRPRSAFDADPRGGGPAKPMSKKPKSVFDM